MSFNELITKEQKDINYVIHIILGTILESILKSTLKRQLPYLAGGTITGIFMTYYYGLLFSIIVNSVMWFAISTVINKYYWHYTGFKDELFLVSKYIIHRKKSDSKNIQDIGIVDDHNGE